MTQWVIQQAMNKRRLYVEKIIEVIYGWTKAYMLKQAAATGNQQFLTNLTNALTAVEVAWLAIKNLVQQQAAAAKKPVAPKK